MAELADRYLILPAGPGDAEAIARVHVTSWRETYRGLLPDAYLAGLSAEAQARRWRRALAQPRPGEVALVAEGADGVVGYAAGAPSRSGRGGEAEVQTLYVLARAQGRGIGRALLSGQARALAAAGASAMLIGVLTENHAARGFYERLGGVAGPPTREPGPGGTNLEVAYRWADIRALF